MTGSARGGWTRSSSLVRWWIPGRPKLCLRGGSKATPGVPCAWKPTRTAVRLFPMTRPPLPPDRDPAMAVAADALATRLRISRARQEDWAVASHAKALNSDHSVEIVPLLGVTRDAYPRRLSPGLLARAPIVHGSITAATAAVAADAAALCLVVSDRLAQGRGLAILSGATAGGTPEEPGLAPLAAITRIWQGEPLTIAEIMEAYAVQAVAVVEGARINPAIVNLGGGGLARGHPVGASGSILAVRLFHGLRQGRGLAAIAAAGGIGTALLVEASGA